MVPFLDLRKINQLHQIELVEAVKRVSCSGWYLMSNETRLFEEEYAKFIGTEHAVGVGNGLDAITIIFRAFIEMGLMKEGDEVIVPANTFIASVIAVIRAGLTPVFVDADPHTLLMDEHMLSETITENTKALMIVHLYGKCAYSQVIKDLCDKHGLLLVEDNAQAQGCTYHSLRTGALGDAAAHSFYPAKNIGALGDAGAITTNNQQMADTVRAIANYGFHEKYYADVFGCNSRIDEIQAAVLRVKLKYLDVENNIRKRIAKYYHDNIQNPFVTIPKSIAGQDNVYHLFPVISEYRDQLQNYLKHNDIQTVIHYPVPPHKQKALKCYNDSSLPVTESIAKTELSLPISQVMTDEQINKVVEIVNKFQC